VGTISSGVGLVSGLDIEGLVQKLMAIESRPVTLLENQQKELDARKAAYMSISAKLLALKLTVTPFKSAVTFRPREASSSDEQVLTATATSSANPGSYDFRVLQTARAQQMVSYGFADPDRTSIGEGTISIESYKARLDRDTPLSFLNGQRGVSAGRIRITDRSGASADIDLTTALTVRDVLDAINAASGIDVTASISGDALVITDDTGQTVGNLTVEDLDGGRMAMDLGIAGSVADNAIVGQDVNSLSEGLLLRALNDGNGVRTSGTGLDIHFKLGDGSEFDVGLDEILKFDTPLNLLNGGLGVRLGSIEITNRAGQSAVIDLSAAATIQDVTDAISNAGISVSAAIVGNKLLITDGTGKEDSDLVVQNYGDSHTATDLGIEGTSTTNALTGRRVYHVQSLGDVMRIIEVASGGKLDVQISSDGNALTLVDTSGGGGPLEVSPVGDSQAAYDLGLVGTGAGGALQGRALIAGLNTVLLRSLNGGSGVASGRISIQDRTGTVSVVDLSNAVTLQDVLDAINDPSVAANVRAEINSSGRGVIITDLTGSTAANLKISDVDSTTASDLGIVVDGAVNSVDSRNNQLQWISESTLLSELNQGNGVQAGSFSIIDSAGRRSVITIDDDETLTVGDVIDQINNQADLGVTASINATGDGILLTDTAGGSMSLRVEDQAGGVTARDLGLLGQADLPGAGTLDGSFEYNIEVGRDDTLQSVADKINQAAASVQADVMYDGSAVNGYRLIVNSAITGSAGRFIFDSDIAPLEMTDLVAARDAIISFGQGQTGGVRATSSTNKFADVIPGLVLDVHAPSAAPVTVSVQADIDAVVEKISGFVEKFNDVVDLIDDLTKYDPETQEGGALLGEVTANLIKDRLFQAVRTVVGSGGYSRLSQLGVKVASGAKLELDEDVFRSAVEQDAEQVIDFFTAENGFASVADDLLDELTRSYDGTIARTTDRIEQKKELITDRIDYLQDLLDKKEQRLYRQFYAMETALSNLQYQQNALLSFTPIQPINTSANIG